MSRRTGHTSRHAPHNELAPARSDHPSNPRSPGVKTAPTVMELAREYGVEMPIAAEVEAVVAGRHTPTEAYRGLRKRAPGDEEDLV